MATFTAAYVQVAPNSTGQMIDGAMVTDGGNSVMRQIISLGDPVVPGGVAQVLGAPPVGIEAGLVTRPILPPGAAQETGGNLAILAASSAQDAPLFLNLVGDPSGDFGGVNLLESVLTGEQSLATRPGAPGQTPSGGAQSVTIASDQAQDAMLTSPGSVAGLNQPLFLIDTMAGGPTSYRSFGLEIIGSAGITAGAITISGSNSGQPNSWVPLPSYDVAPSTGLPIQGAITISASTFRFFIGKLPFRYLKVFVTTAFTGGTIQGFLRLSVIDVAPQIISANISNIAGNPIGSGGTAGTSAIGGLNAPGIAPATNPVQVGGADPGGLTRRLLMDTLGNLNTAGNVAPGLPPTANPLPLGGSDLAGLTRRITLDALGNVQVGNASEQEILLLILAEIRTLTTLTHVGFSLNDDLDQLRAESLQTSTLQ